MKNLPQGEQAHEYQISLQSRFCGQAPNSIADTQFQPSFGIFFSENKIENSAFFPNKSVMTMNVNVLWFICCVNFDIAEPSPVLFILFCSTKNISSLVNKVATNTYL